MAKLKSKEKTSEFEEVKQSSPRISKNKHKQIERHLIQARRTLDTIVACQEVIALAHTKSDLLHKICEVFTQIGGFRMAWIGIAHNSKFIKPLAYSGIVDGYLDPRKLTYGQKDEMEYPAAKAIREGKPYLAQDIVSESKAISWQPEALKRGYSSVLALPLVSNQKTFGSLCLYASETAYFSENDTKYFNKLAENIVYSIVALQTRKERYRAEGELEKSLETLRKTLSAIIEAMERTVEVRDPYTAGHQRRVADLARSIANHMKLSKDTLDGIRIGGILHDIGKIYVPIDILMKPRKLTTVEFSLIKLHPQVGYDILKSIDFPWPVAKIILQHHERINGSGYPQGLKNDKIMIEAKILGVADVVEAMASHRPYRPSLGIEKALEEIRSKQGTLYDSDIVKACDNLFHTHSFAFKDV